MDNNKKKLHRAYMGAAVASLIFIGIGVYVSVSDSDTADTIRNNLPIHMERQKNIPFMEDHTDSGEKIEIGQDKKEKIQEDLLGFQTVAGAPNLSQNANLLLVNGNYFYLFNDNVLLPLSNKDWKEYVIPSSSDTYASVHEYYLEEEKPETWTQKFTIHKINSADKDCFDFTDKLINGVLVNISEQMSAKGHTFSNDNVDFNYVKKHPDNTVMYWEHIGIPDTNDETQFVRVFISEYSKDMYLITYTLKDRLNNLPDDIIISSLGVINSVQELKKK